RTGPGRALRLYGKRDHDARPEHHAPEIERLDLAGTVLELRAAGIDPAQLPWLDPPPPSSLGTAEQLLRRLGCIDGAITDLGRACARFPLHPRLSRLVLEASRRGFGADGCTLAAFLSENEARAVDVLELLDQPRSRRVEQARAQLQRSLPEDGPQKGSRDEAIRISVLSGFPDRVARRRGDELLLASGGAAQIAHDAPQKGLLVAVDAEEQRDRGRSRVVVRLACAIEAEWLLDDVREETQLVWDPSRGRAFAVRRLLHDQLVLEESRGAPQDAAAAAEMLFQHASFDRARIDELVARAAAVAQHCPESGVRAPSEEEIQRALRRACEGLASLEDLRGIDLAAAIFPPAARAALDRLAPGEVALASGRKLRVEYAPGQPPSVRSRLQDFFGMSRGPAICDGRLPLVLHLLAPNGRAQQVTQDLAGFWQRHYPAVRRELMRRYPRHAWPDDGATASPPAPRR
ncbi:MAG TPA: ATP-dependent helicase C-terminal domain-containing protein, partial [Myxococcales bacterium]